MYIIRNRWFPFGKFVAINICGVIFTKANLGKTLQYHEYIHTIQQRELLYVFFYAVYLLEWALRLLVTHDAQKAYRNISFEHEAYANQHNFKYHHHRPFCAWTHYVSRHGTD